MAIPLVLHFFLILIPGQSNWDGLLGSFYVSLHACLIYLLTLPQKKKLKGMLETMVKKK